MYTKKFYSFYYLKENSNLQIKVKGSFYVNSALEELILDELRCCCAAGSLIINSSFLFFLKTSMKGSYGGFLPAVKQIANVAALPGSL
jgi:hypothetical protein